MRRRSGFTLVELLVAMALIVFMMLILSEAFSVGLDSFRRLKALGDMNARMRTAAGILRRDLQADHFEGKRRLSSATFWNLGPPREGFFRIWQGSPAIIEGTDGDGLPSTRATDHMLHFTAKLRGNDRHDFLTARVPLGSPLLNLGRADSRYQTQNDESYNSQWFEVAYFLRRNGNAAGATPLYALYRRQKLVMPESPDVRRLNWGQGPADRVPITPTTPQDYAEISCKPNPQAPGFLYFNTPTELTIPQRRFGMDPSPTANGGLPTVRPDPNDMRTWTYPTLGEESAALEGSDLLLPDVLSFEVALFVPLQAVAVTAVAPGVTWVPEFIDLFNPYLNEQSGMDNPLFTGANAPRVFDTWTDDTWADGPGAPPIYDYSTWSQTGALATTATVPLHRRPRRPPTTGFYQFIRIQGVKITLRVWDVKTQQARQITIIQDL